MSGSLIILVALFAVLWIVMIRPQRAKQQKQRELLSSVEPGDEILTVGGIYGIVQEIEDEEDGEDLIVEIAEGIHVRVAGRAVATVVKLDTEDDDAADEDAEDGEDGDADPGAADLDDATDPDTAPRLRAERKRRAATFRAHMTRRAATIVVALVALALVGVALLAIPSSPIHKKTTLGLDLRGRARGDAASRAAEGPAAHEGSTSTARSRSVRDRVDRLGVSEPEIRKQGSDQIAIQLPGVKDPAAAAKIIGKTAQLELFDLEANLAPPSIDASRSPALEGLSVYALLAGQQALAAKGTPEHKLGSSTRRKSSPRARSRPRRWRCANKVFVY